MIIKNEKINLDITTLTSEGNGIGRYNNMVIFVPNTLPGDKIIATIVKVLKSHAFAEVDSFLHKSSNRIENDCISFPKCGGCTLRELEYAKELEAKRSFVVENIRRIAKLSPEFEDITPSPKETRYRNKVQLPIAVVNGKAEIGIFASRSHQLVPLKDCKLQPEIFINIANVVKEFINQNDISIYNEGSHKGLLRHLCLRVNSTYTEIMVIFVINGKNIPKQKELSKVLTSQFPEIKSIILSHNTAKTSFVMGKTQTTLWGKTKISDELLNTKFEISASSFFQVNHYTTALLYGKVSEFAQPKANEIILDLYCGIGSIGLCIAKNAKQLMGVEIVPDAVENAQKNARLNNVTSRFICSDAGQAAAKLASENLNPNTVIIDPPRKGIDHTTLNAICQMNPEKVVYVSCDSATLARDLKIFAENGYNTTKVATFDMFPRTKHVECVCLLTRTEG